MNKIGIVLVSHVCEIALGLQRLIKEVAPDVPITLAAGIEDNGIGTNAETIVTAFEENQGQILFAFYDLGSAKMNLELAEELTDKTVHLFDTALIESAYTAAALLQVAASEQEIIEQLTALKIK